MNATFSEFKNAKTTYAPEGGGLNYNLVSVNPKLQAGTIV